MPNQIHLTHSEKQKKSKNHWTVPWLSTAGRTLSSAAPTPFPFPRKFASRNFPLAPTPIRCFPAASISLARPPYAG